MSQTKYTLPFQKEREGCRVGNYWITVDLKTMKANSKIYISILDVKELFMSPILFYVVDCNTSLLGCFYSSFSWQIYHVSVISTMLGAPRKLQARGPETDSMVGSLKEESGTEWQKCGLFLCLTPEGGALEV